jgi:aspartate/methionine/tyrosine aminotransferase
MCSLLENDDEIIVFEPVFEFYYKQAQIFGANVKFLEMTPPKRGSTNWTYDFEKIENSITDKTRILLLNTPHNPTGKVLTEEEIQNFISIVKKWPNLIVVSDEVHPHPFFIL